MRALPNSQVHGPFPFLCTRTVMGWPGGICKMTVIWGHRSDLHFLALVD